VAAEALRRGLLVLPAGDDAQVVELSPPVVLTGEQEEHAVTTLIDVLGSGAGGGLP
jgi:4-aminobutyrate aminotransferase-like enzyme